MPTVNYNNFRSFKYELKFLYEQIAIWSSKNSMKSFVQFWNKTFAVVSDQKYKMEVKWHFRAWRQVLKLNQMFLK